MGDMDYKQLLEELSNLMDTKRFEVTNEVAVPAIITYVDTGHDRSGVPILKLVVSLELSTNVSLDESKRWRLDNLLRSTGITEETFKKSKTAEILTGKECRIRLAITDFQDRKVLTVRNFEM